ncbi:MAG: LysE family transporter, partial [Desulfobacterales bacterium]
TWFRLLGGLFLCYLGTRAFRAKPARESPAEFEHNHAAAYGTTFLLTLTNPMTILAFAAIFAGLGLVRPPARYASAALLVLGVFLGSGLWWFCLSAFTALFRQRLTPSQSVWVNRISGMIIAAFGLAALLSLTR